MKRKQNTKKKPRQTIMTFDMGKPVCVNGIIVDPKSGKITLLNNSSPLLSNQSIVTVGYDRPKGLKSLIRADIDPNFQHLNPNKALEQYDLLLAVDTNSKNFNQEIIAVTSIIMGQHTGSSIPGENCITISVLNCFEFRNPQYKPENIGWQLVISGLLENSIYKDSMNVALIVDSDLDMHNEYNNRLKPIVEEFYLPKNFKLIYASADSSTESVANKMIAKADSVSTNLLNQIINSNDLSNLIKIEDQPFSLFRQWKLS